MIKYAEPIMRKRFTDEDLKTAKKKALQWIGKYVACREELADVSYALESEEDPIPVVTVTLFAMLDEHDARERHCQLCQEFHSHFFINENCNCSECKALALENRMSDMLRTKKSYYRECLKGILGKEE